MNKSTPSIKFHKAMEHMSIFVMPPLHWQRTYDQDRNEKSIFISCENGHIAGLDHEINEKGVITPSIVCPTDGCGFHVFGELVGY